MKRRSVRSIQSLVDELISLSPEASADRIANDRRFHSLELARRLAELSAAALPERPEDSTRLASTVLELLDRLPTGTRKASACVLASCSMGNAYRLLGDFTRALAVLDSVAHAVTLKEDSALHLRTYAILRWELDHSDEAIGLLIRAERLYRDCGLVLEASATSQLLILIYAEMGEAADAITLFRHLGPVDPTVRPWLGARAALTAAFVLADRPDLALPEEDLAALALGDSLFPYVRDPDELLELEWLKARAQGRMGHHDEAARTFLALRRRLCPAGVRDLNFQLLTMDLLAVRVAAGLEAVDLLEELEATPPSIAKLPTLTDPLRLWLASERSGPWIVPGFLQLLLRRTFRAHRLPMARLPFA